MKRLLTATILFIGVFFISENYGQDLERHSVTNISEDSFDKQGNWTNDEKLIYKNLYKLCNYATAKKKKLSKDTLFKKYIYFDYVLNDDDTSRRDSRVQKFDTIFYRFRHYVDSIGLENLDAKPIRFFKHTEFYRPFKNQELQSANKIVFAYYLKSNPQTPKGSLLFDKDTKKLVAWILINQGGYYYYLTFNLL